MLIASTEGQGWRYEVIVQFSEREDDALTRLPRRCGTTGDQHIERTEQPELHGVPPTPTPSAIER